MEKKTKTAKRKIYSSSNFFTADVNVSKKFVTVQLPIKVAEYLQLKEGEKVFWAPTNGVIQISGNQPVMVIPMMGETSTQFLPK